MKFLLDTHTFLWFALNDPQLSERALKLITNPANEVLISPASYWELAIKIGIGKYMLQQTIDTFFEDQLSENQFEILPIEPRHVAPLTKLDFHHRDPFDRLIIAQAMIEDISIISADSAFDAYPVTRIW